MSNRSAKFASAMFACLFAGSSLAATSQGATNTAEAADPCVSAPKGALPQGGHWYYRIDRATKRHCWYVGEAKEKPTRAVARENSPTPAEPAPPPKDAAAQRSISDAHAELPSPQTRPGQEAGIPIGQQQILVTAPNALSAEYQPANAQDANAQRSVFASRWPETSGVNAPADPGPAADDSDAGAQADATAAPAATLASVTLTAADASSQSEPGSIQMLLVVIFGALALAGLMGSAIFRFGSSRRISRSDIRLDRRAIWDSADTDQASPSIYPNPAVPTRRVEIPRELREAKDPNGRIEAMLERLARSAAH
jgi:hypothetical protein